MAGHVLRHGLWLAVCDGKKALLVENTGDHEYPKFETRETHQIDNPLAHELASDKPGRVFSSAGSRRSAVEEPDYHDQAEFAFLKQFAQTLDAAVKSRGIKSLMLIAPARALGMIRPELTDATRAVMAAELDKDYVKLPLHEIERQLKRADA